jgi:uncharacterized membrane protein YcfT
LTGYIRKITSLHLNQLSSDKLRKEVCMRQDWIDSLKGMAIVLVVIGHLNTISNELNQYIYSFHMPLFFFFFLYLINFENYINM